MRHMGAARSFTTHRNQPDIFLAWHKTSSVFCLRNVIQAMNQLCHGHNAQLLQKTPSPAWSVLRQLLEQK